MWHKIGVREKTESRMGVREKKQPKVYPKQVEK